jgi:3-dehydroquinate synthase
MNTTRCFNFGGFESIAHIRQDIPTLGEIAVDFGGGFFSPLLVCDEHTALIADTICGGNGDIPRCVLQSGESGKGWPAVEAILATACGAGLGRDAVFIGVGGGVIGDLTAFAASVYMRGCGLALICTTLLSMVDAGLGGKSGFDLFGVKNLAGAFYPARHVYLPLESLASLPPAEWKSGMAELIKTAVLETQIENGDFLDKLSNIAGIFPTGAFASGFPPDFASFLFSRQTEQLAQYIGMAVCLKGRIVESDPKESGGKRVLLNLGHTFGHALEAVAGLGKLSHGEAVAWGMARSCELGLALGITPRMRAEKIKSLLAAFGYETAAPHPLMNGTENFLRALGSDKKKRCGTAVFIVPGKSGAQIVSGNSNIAISIDNSGQAVSGFDVLIPQIINGALSF